MNKTCISPVFDSYLKMRVKRCRVCRIRIRESFKHKIMNLLSCKKCSVPPSKSIYSMFDRFKDIRSWRILISAFVMMVEVPISTKAILIHFFALTNILIISKRLFHLVFESRINFSSMFNCAWICFCRISSLRGLLRNIFTNVLTFPITSATKLLKFYTNCFSLHKIYSSFINFFHLLFLKKILNPIQYYYFPFPFLLLQRDFALHTRNSLLLNDNHAQNRAGGCNKSFFQNSSSH